MRREEEEEEGLFVDHEGLKMLRLEWDVSHVCSSPFALWPQLKET